VSKELNRTRLVLVNVFVGSLTSPAAGWYTHRLGGDPALARQPSAASDLAFSRPLAMSEVTRILSAIEQGDPHAADQLLPLVYQELRQLAAQKLAREAPGQTLQATALVHEAYLRLVDVPEAQRWNSRGHFFAAAAEAMRRILVESARRHGARKRGGDRQRVELPELRERPQDDPLDLLALDDALRKLEAQHPDKAQIVKLRFFAGCSLEETAQLLGFSRATAQRHWAFARAWLFGRLNQS
jgi:RNA polymerase sigma factor (TIGR02999 family)